MPVLLFSSQRYINTAINVSFLTTLVACGSGTTSVLADATQLGESAFNVAAQSVSGVDNTDAIVVASNRWVNKLQKSAQPYIGAASPDRETQDVKANGSFITVGAQPGDAQCLDFGSQTQDFGQVTVDDWRQWMPDFYFAMNEEYLSVVDDNNLKILRHKYNPTSTGSNRVVVGSNLEPYRTYRIRQSVYLEPGWEWGGDTYEGGKLGFGFGGGTIPSGGIVDPAGFTARIMWRGNYLGGGQYDGTGRLVIYSYNADRPENIGQDTQIGDYVVPIGEWFDAIFEIRLNSSTSASDGSMKAWINGELLLDRGGIAWQSKGGTPVIDTLFYSSFYGGGNPGWAPSKPTYARFKDVCFAPVVDGYSGIDPDNGRIVLDRSSNSRIAAGS